MRHYTRTPEEDKIFADLRERKINSKQAWAMLVINLCNEIRGERYIV